MPARASTVHEKDAVARSRDVELLREQVAHYMEEKDILFEIDLLRMMRTSLISREIFDQIIAGHRGKQEWKIVIESADSKARNTVPKLNSSGRESKDDPAIQKPVSEAAKMAQEFAVVSNGQSKTDPLYPDYGFTNRMSDNHRRMVTDRWRDDSKKQSLSFEVKEEPYMAQLKTTESIRESEKHVDPRAEAISMPAETQMKDIYQKEEQQLKPVKVHFEQAARPRKRQPWIIRHKDFATDANHT